ATTPPCPEPTPLQCRRRRGRRPPTRCAVGPRRSSGSRAAREAREVGRAPLVVGVAALLALLGHIEEQGGVTGQLLDTGQSALGPVWPKRALSAAMVRSQTRCRTWPPPMA